MASGFYNNGLQDILDGGTDLLSNSIKCALVTSSYTFNADHDNFDEITNEVSGSGYTAGGETLASKAVNKDTTNDRAEFDAADITAWSGASGWTARAAVLYKDTGTASTSTLICYVDFGADKSAPISSLTWNSEGIFAFGQPA